MDLFWLSGPSGGTKKTLLYFRREIGESLDDDIHEQ